MSQTPVATTESTPGLAKAYDPRLVEPGVYDRWDDAGYFQPLSGRTGSRSWSSCRRRT